MEYEVGSKTYFIQDGIVYRAMITKVLGINGSTEYDLMIMHPEILPKHRRVLFEIETGRILRTRVNKNGFLEEKV